MWISLFVIVGAGWICAVWLVVVWLVDVHVHVHVHVRVHVWDDFQIIFGKNLYEFGMISRSIFDDF